MNADSNHWHQFDRAHEDAGAAVDARDLAIAAKVDAFKQHGGIWANRRFHTMDDVLEIVYRHDDYTNWWRRKECSEGRQQEVIGLEYRPLMERLEADAITIIATLAVMDDLEDAA